jgi:hypothetical protein
LIPHVNVDRHPVRRLLAYARGVILAFVEHAPRNLVAPPLTPMQKGEGLFL